MDAYNYIIAGCVIVIASYIFNIIAQSLKIPAVLLLIGTGIGINYMVSYYGVNFYLEKDALSILGTIGLILIVLEGSLDLKLDQERKKLINNSLLISLVMMLLTSFAVAFALQFFTKAPFISNLMYAIPLAVISSAIVIPSVHGMDGHKKEFMIYEATFSDIVGIVFFYLFAFYNIMTLSGIATFLGSFVATLALSLVFSLVLLFALDKIKLETKIFFLFSILVLVFAVGKKLHLSSLILILAFGLILNNTHLIKNTKLGKYFNDQNLQDGLNQFKIITFELSFFVRTMFFVMFGFSMNLESLLDTNTILMGVVSSALVFAIRFAILKLMKRDKHGIFPEILIAPRGLITILLYLSIPAQYIIPEISEGVLLFVIIVSVLAMMVGLMSTPDTHAPDTLKRPEEY
ncbi:MAG TPA: cation:proton antiporter [Bacteroidia bacterium]|nr:cation:proton antiporter [Bacteroidia bacterium]